VWRNVRGSRPPTLSRYGPPTTTIFAATIVPHRAGQHATHSDVSNLRAPDANAASSALSPMSFCSNTGSGYRETRCTTGWRATTQKKPPAAINTATFRRRCSRREQSRRKTVAEEGDAAFADESLRGKRLGQQSQSDVSSLNEPPTMVAIPRNLAPTGIGAHLSTSAAATPSGNCSFCSMMSVRRSGTEKQHAQQTAEPDDGERPPVIETLSDAAG